MTFIMKNDMNTKRKGDITETKILIKLLEHGFNILVPYGDNSRYDLVFENDNIFYRIQCKTGRLRDGKIIFNCSSHHPRDYKKIDDYHGDVDYFGVHCFENDKSYLIPIEFIGKTSQHLRILTPINNQKKNILWGHLFEI